MIAQLDLFDELSFYEGIDVEYKAAKGGLPRDLWETCSAFANTEGGTVWLGISQREQGLDIHGVVEPEKLVQDFWNTINNRSKINRNLLNARDVTIIEAPGPIRLVRIEVPRADRRQRPVFVGNDPFQGTYRRNYEGDYRCTESEVRRMFADQAEEPADSRILEGFNLEDLHPDSLRQFRNRFASVRGAGHAWLAEDDRGLLIKLGGWRRDRGSGKEGLTVAGLLMFGRDQAIRDPAGVPGFHLDYRERFSDDPDVRWTDRLTIDGTWEGNLFQFYQLVSLKFSSGPGVKRPFGVDDEGYRRAGTPVSEALQEALVNALIHGDYSGQGGIVIDRHIDRLVFSNPGSLLLSREQLLRGGISECRNKSLQLMFQMLGSGDKAGSGIDKIRSSWLAQHWQSPSLRETHQPERIVLDLPMISTLPEEVLHKLDQRFGERFTALGSDEIQAIVTAHIEGSVTNQRLQEMLTLHRVDITHMLRGLVQRGLLCSDGVGRGTRYHLPPEDGNGASSETNGARLESRGASSVDNGVSSMANGASWVSSSDQRGITAPAPVQRRLKPEQTRAAILDVCAKNYLSAQEIAGLLNRGRKRLLAEFLRPMCDEGILIMRYPEAPNHKQQAYRANSPLEAEEALSIMTIDRQSLIINSAFECPTHHWRRKGDDQLELIAGRRPAGYEIFDTRNKTLRTVELPLVNSIRERIKAWRDADYPGITAITRQLLEHWRDPDTRRLYEFYFCQLEAIETLIWRVEAAAEFKQGIAIPGDGGAWERLCNKMATGSGKTTVMAMIITWQVLNALTYPKRNKDFSRAIFIVTPGLTVKERLKVLYTGHPDNYYDAFALCPNEALRQKLNQAEVLIDNWHNLMPYKPPTKSVVRKGQESDEAFVRRVLGKLSGYKDLVIINDEAHHAYRKPAERKISKKEAEELGIDLEEATCWIEGLDRIHKMRRIQRCFDLSATPFAPTGKTNTEAGLFEWVISDFGLNDAIESGLVKTPRVVIRDNALPNTQTYKSKLYHLYREPGVADDLNRRGAEPHEPLPELVQQAYTLLGADWMETRTAWLASGHTTPPVLLTVCNRTETAARIEHYFRQGNAFWPELKQPESLLRVDSRVLDKAEIGETATADKAYETILQAIVESADIPATRKDWLLGLKKEELLRELIDSVGKRGGAGQDLRNVISVAMLSEGWDAKTVTHILGLRAFTSQLLCEQVIGRGLRRVAYETEEVVCPDGVVRRLFTPEYVNVFGVPLSIFQGAGDGDPPPPPPKASTQIEVVPERSELEITWPNVLRVDYVVRPELTLDLGLVPLLKIDPAEVRVSADLAPALGGAANLAMAVAIDLEKIPEAFRPQRLLFLAAYQALGSLEHGFTGGRESLVLQLVRLVERFLQSDRLNIPSLFHQDPPRKRILIALSIDRVVAHVVAHIQQQNQEGLEPVFDAEYPIGSTRLMRPWHTTKPCQATVKSHISHAVADSTWEQFTTNTLESRKEVAAYAKNDHLGFHIYYLWRGSKRKFIPDFIIRLGNGKLLVLEIKGVDSDQNRAKRLALDAWVRAVNARGGFGVWCWDVAKGEIAKVYDVVLHHAQTAGPSDAIGEGILTGGFQAKP